MRRLLILILLCPLFGLAQTFEFNENCKKAYNSVIMLNFEDAERRVSAERSANPDNLCYVFIDNYIDFYKLVFFGNKDKYNDIASKRRTNIEQFDKLSDSNPYKKFAQSSVNFQWAVSNFKFGDYYSGALNLRKAFLLIEKNSKLFPDFDENALVSGLLNTIIGAVPPSMQWILRLASMSGSTERGLAQLSSFATATQTEPRLSIFRTETLIYNMVSYTTIINDIQKGDSVLAYFTPADLNNNLVLYAIAIQQKEKRDFDGMRITLTRYHENHSTPVPVLEYMTGNLNLNNGDVAMAKTSFKTFLQFNTMDHRADALRKLGWIAFLEGDTLGWQSYMQMVQSTPIGIVGNDDDALKEAKSGVMPHRELLMSRILFDGNNYAQALLALDSMDTTDITENQHLELIYRKGRIYDGMGNNAMTVACYKRVIAQGQSNPEYYAANAALKLGEYYMSKGDNENAKLYFRKCLEMNPNQYKNSLHQKAKSHLNKLGD